MCSCRGVWRFLEPQRSRYKPRSKKCEGTCKDEGDVVRHLSNRFVCEIFPRFIRYTTESRKGDLEQIGLWKVRIKVPQRAANLDFVKSLAWPRFPESAGWLRNPRPLFSAVLMNRGFRRFYSKKFSVGMAEWRSWIFNHQGDIACVPRSHFMAELCVSNKTQTPNDIFSKVLGKSLSLHDLSTNISNHWKISKAALMDRTNIFCRQVSS